LGAKIAISFQEQRMELLALLFKIAQKDYLLRCPVCGYPKVTRLSSVLRALLTSHVGTNKHIHLQVDVKIVECKKCHNRRQIELKKIAASKKRHIKSFPETFSFTYRKMSIRSVSGLFFRKH
jgi:hypothetical protein